MYAKTKYNIYAISSIYAKEASQKRIMRGFFYLETFLIEINHLQTSKEIR